jgi:hypothetical protein
MGSTPNVINSTPSRTPGATTPTKSAASGNRVILKISGQAIGTCSNVSFDDDFNLQEVDGLGNMEIVEHVVGKVTHRISGEKYFISAATLQQLGFVPYNDEWVTAEELSVEVIDTVSGETIENYTGCKFNTHSRRYTKHQVTGENFQILARHRTSQR